MWATFGKKPQLMYLEQFFGFHPPSSNVCRMARGIWEKDWGELLPKAPSDNWKMKNAVSDGCYTVVL